MRELLARAHPDGARSAPLRIPSEPALRCWRLVRSTLEAVAAKAAGGGGGGRGGSGAVRSAVGAVLPSGDLRDMCLDEFDLAVRGREGGGEGGEARGGEGGSDGVPPSLMN